MKPVMPSILPENPARSRNEAGVRSPWSCPQWRSFYLPELCVARSHLAKNSFEIQQNPRVLASHVPSLSFACRKILARNEFNQKGKKAEKKENSSRRLSDSFIINDGLCVCVCVCVCMLSCLVMPTVCNPMDCSLPDFSVLGISQVRILECVAISSFRG